MKSSVIAILVLGLVVAGGTILYLNRQKTPPPPAPVAESAPAPATTPQPEKTTAPKIETPPAVPANTAEAAPAAPATPVADTAKSDAAAALSKTVDALLAPHITAAQKHDLFQQLIKSGQLEAAITELKQRAVDDPKNAEIPTTLGEAQLNQLRAIRDSGGDINDIGILAMQADQSFNAALKIDPSNWEAQFVKAASMSKWPADPTRDADTAQRLSNLIDQQETMTQQPLFAQTYAVLGDQYQKMGQPDKAQATWQLGLTKFPNDPTLQKKLNGQ